jgi:hypothetical protein
MTFTPEQPAALPQDHPAAAYYPAAPDTPEPPRNLTALGVVAFACAAIVTALVWGNALVIGRVIELGGVADDLGTADWSLGVYYLTSLMTYPALLAAWATGAMWLRRARHNAEVLNPGRAHARRAGWAWGGWVVPLVAFWFPYQVVRDVDAAVSPRAPAKDLVGWWWAGWLATVAGWRISESARSGALDTGAGAFGVQTGSLLTAVVTVVALTMWGLVLQRVTNEQHAVMYGVRALED